MPLPDKDFEKLLVSNQSKLYDYCRKLTRHRERAEDLQQETNARAWTKRELYKSDDNFLSWLKTVARNYHLNAVKKEALIPIKTVPHFSENADSADAEEYFTRKQGSSQYAKMVSQPNQEDAFLENQIMEVIAALPPHHALLVNKKLEGLTYKEICIALGIKDNNAKQRYFNVLKWLRQRIREKGLLDE